MRKIVSMKRILLCTDGSAYSEVASRYAHWLAGRAKARQVTGLYVSDLRQFEIPVVADLSGSLGIQPYQGAVSKLQDLEKEKAKLIGAAFLDLMGSLGGEAEADFATKTGLLVDVIEDMQDDFDVIVLGKRGENANFAREHLGSNMERVVRASSKPVLATNRAYREVKRVVFAYDGGHSCRRALAFLERSEALADLDFRLVTVAEDGEEEAASRHLAHAEGRLKEAGYTPMREMLSGEVGTAISDYIEQQDIDLLIMGAYGHSRIRYLLIGSTTTEMMRRCQVPVLCFR